MPGVETSWPVEESPSLIYRNLSQRVVYLVGIGYLAIALVRLMRLGIQWWWLQQMLGKAQPADSQVSTFCAAVANRWQLKRCPRIVVSDKIEIPLAAGVLHPVIVLPAGFWDRLSPVELQFVISHECSHIAEHDLHWALLSEVVRCVLWPHPLVWRLPELHRAACDLRCDAAVAGRDYVRYRKMLAELALNLNCRQHRLPAMSFATPSDIIRRVDRLQHESDAAALCGRRRLGAAALMCLLSIAGTVSINGCADEIDADATDEVEITVLNENDEPVVGADVRVDGLRTKKESASAYGNRLQTSGKTNDKGIATVKYPRYVLEEMETGHLCLTVTHPEYSLQNIQTYDLELREAIHLQAGRRLTVNAIDSNSGDRITQGLHVLLPGRVGSEVWTNGNDGTLVSSTVDRETSCLLLVCLQEGKPTLFSDLIDLGDFGGDDVTIDKIPMSPGKRVTGRLSDNVTTPVENGYVGLCVSMAPDTVSSYDTCIMWSDYTTVAADGTFEFESIPREADIQLTAISDGWVSVSAEPTSVLERFPYVTTPQHAENMHNTITISQSFPPETQQPLILEMEQTATCHFLVVDVDDQPVAAAQIFMSPNTANAPGPGGIVGYYYRTAATLGMTEAERGQVTPEAKRFRMRYQATTDGEGKATIESVPPQRGIGVDIYHPKLEMSSGERGEFHRGTHVQLTPGETQDVTLRVEAKGAEVLGR